MDANSAQDVPQEAIMTENGETAAPPTRRRTPFIAVSVVLVVVIATIAIVNVTSNSSAGAAAAVRQALVDSVNMKSAAFNLDETISTGGTTVSVTGIGACTFVTVDCQMSMNFGGALSADGTVAAIFTNGVMYMKFSGPVASALPTPWISLPLNLSKIKATSGLSSSASPLAALSLLAQKGAVVTNDGAVTVNGNSLTEYTVTGSGTVSQNLVNSAKGALPQWMTSQAAGASAGPFTMTVDVNGADELASIQMNTTATSTAGVTGNVGITETITNYGVPVNVSIPPASQVTSIASLESSLGTS